MPRPAPPKRATATLGLGFGPIVIPTSLYTGTEESRVSRKEFVKVDGELHPVGRKRYNKSTGEDVSSDQVLKMFETESGAVEVNDDEIETILEVTPGSANIIGFVPIQHLASGHYVTESMYQVRPAKMTVGKTKKPNPAAERAFGLLVQAMRKSGTFALVEFTLRGTPRYGALVPNGRLYTLRFDQEVRADLEMPEPELNENDLGMMLQLVKSHTLPEPPELVDNHSNAIREYAFRKAESGEAVTPAEHSTGDDATDLSAALAAALRGEA